MKPAIFYSYGARQGCPLISGNLSLLVQVATTKLTFLPLMSLGKGKFSLVVANKDLFEDSIERKIVLSP